MPETELRLVKLVTGEDLVGFVNPKNRKVILDITDPLLLEHRLTMDGAIAILMTTYIPHKETPTVTLQPDTWITVTDISAELTNYYLASRDYCQKHQDEDMRKAMVQAAKNMNKAMRELDESETEIKAMSRGKGKGKDEEARVIKLGEISPGSSANN